MLLQVYKYFFCNKNRRRSLLLRHFDDSNGEESLNVLNTICIFKNFILVLWKSLKHPKVYLKKSVNSWECIKVCSVESGLKHRGHLSSEANLYFISSFLVGIILCITLKENCLSLLSFEDLYISTKQLLQSGSSGKYFLQDLIAEGSVSSNSINSLKYFYSEI